MDKILNILELDTLSKRLFCILIATLWFSYGLNIVKLTQCDFQYPYKAEAIRMMGVVTPSGFITGWMGSFGR
jgi:hypothetical protein